MIKSTVIFIGIACLQLFSMITASAQTTGPLQFCPNATPAVQELSYGMEENNNGGCVFFHSNAWKSDPIPSRYCKPKATLKFTGVWTGVLSLENNRYQTGVIQCNYKLSIDNYPVKVNSIKMQSYVVPTGNWKFYDNKNYLACESDDVTQCPFSF